MISRKLMYAGLVAALPLALAGCSSSNSGSSAAATTPSAAAAAASSPAAVSTTQLTGSQLSSALLVASDLPSGFAVSSGSPVSSGASITTAAAKYKPASMTCSDLLNDLGQTGFGESAMADNTMVDQNTKEILNQAVYQFASASAANVFFTSLEAKWNSCGTFSASDSSGDTGKLTITATSAPSGLGSMDFANTMAGTEAGSSMTGSNLVALNGDDVFLLGPGSVSTSQPTDLVVQTLMQKLLSNIAAAG